MAQSVSRPTVPVAPAPPRERRVSRVNLPLLAGYALVALVIGVAIAGPAFAPNSPSAREAVVQIGDRFYPPPFPPFRTWDYPLGSDGAGRDLFSQLLWGVRPTMLMVLIVATLRLLLGVIGGLLAGWSDGAGGQAMNGLISGALAAPILIVALAGIAIVGIEQGLIAFVIGLALTGWAETGRLVAEQTRMLRNQPFIQAARALGASGFHVLVRHMLRHVLPLLGMLLAFEISATLMVVAALGFLGYFIGGGTFVQLDDGVVGRFIELPELGQMLATVPVRLNQPGPLLVIGTTIFLIILGFNLLGEGLRRELQQTNRISRLSRLVGRVLGPLEERLLTTTGQWRRGPLLRNLAGGALALALLAGGALWWQSRPVPLADAPPIAIAQGLLTVPGGHLWSGARGSPAGSLAVPEPQLGAAPTLVWTFRGDSGLSGGPAVAADGTLYVATRGGVLYALDPAGNEVWRAELPAGAVGAPALGLTGEIYVVGSDGLLAAFAPDGSPRWQFRAQAGRAATSGPVVAADGSIYYSLVDRVQAVTPAGQGLWLSAPLNDYVDFPPVVSATGEYLFMKGFVLRRGDGALVTLPIGQAQAQQFVQTSYFVGADGQNYHRAGLTLTPWQVTAQGIVPGRTRESALGGGGFFQTPLDYGITSDGLLWLFYSGGFGPGSLFWVDQEGKQSGHISGLPTDSRVVAVDESGVAYVCGLRSGRGACVAATPTDATPRWRVEMERETVIMGGAVAPGRLYVATESGTLYAIGAAAP